MWAFQYSPWESNVRIHDVPNGATLQIALSKAQHTTTVHQKENYRRIKVFQALQKSYGTDSSINTFRNIFVIQCLKTTASDTVYALDPFSFQVGQKLIIPCEYGSLMKINILHHLKLFCIWKWSMVKASKIGFTATYCMAFLRPETFFFFLYRLGIIC